MTRVRKGPARKKARRRLLKAAKGYVGGRSKLYRTAKEAVARAGCYAYRDRRRRKREFRALWITRINAAARARGTSYSELIHGLQKANVQIDRKMLSDMAIHDEKAFDQLVELAKAQVK